MLTGFFVAVCHLYSDDKKDEGVIVLELDKRLSQDPKQWLQACIEDINAGNNLYNLFKSLKPIMNNKMQSYLSDIPYYDKEDYYQIGLITLWDNISRCEGNPDIAEHFLSYYATSVEHAYIHIFREFVMKNDVFVEKRSDWGREYEKTRRGDKL